MHQQEKPYKVIQWSDTLTDAKGWIVIDCLINDVSGGGLFMTPNAEEQEVINLARTMSYKNALQSPRIGGGKGGIRFDPKHLDAEGVLRRFLIDNKMVLEDLWCTGADLNTDKDTIHHIIQEDLKLKAGFHCLGKMLSKKFDFQDHSISMLDRIAEDMTPSFPLSKGATGYTVVQSINLLTEMYSKPRIMLQGFGDVGSSVAYFIGEEQKAVIVGISGVDGFIYDPNGLVD